MCLYWIYIIAFKTGTAEGPLAGDAKSSLSVVHCFSVCRIL